MTQANRQSQIDALRLKCAEQIRQSHIDHYTNSWGNFANSILTALSSGKSPQFVMEAFDRFQNHYDGFIPKWFADQVPVSIAMDMDQTPPRRLHVTDGAYVSATEDEAVELFKDSKGAMLDLISTYIDDDVDCVVEFGSGLGFNLSRLHDRLPSRDIKYMACEPTPAGRVATEAVFAAKDYGNIETMAFDYVRSNLDFLSGYKKVVAFTCHSVEQVVFISDFFEAMMNANIHACVHMEPIGWQRFDEQYDFVIDALLNDKVPGITVSPEQLQRNSAVWAAKSYHNVDLLSCIADNAKQGRIRVTDPLYDFFGNVPFNPSTLVGWSRG
jgi:hypothetical protein